MFKSFIGGVHPDDNKRHTADKPIKKVPMPKILTVPMRQHIGAPCEPMVAVGDKVFKGQLIADSKAFVSAFIHAPTSGTIVEIAEKPHPIFGQCQAIVIESDGLDQWAVGLPKVNKWQQFTNKEIIDLIRQAGIAGLGGATFPTHVKLSPPPDKKIHTLIINAAECEPYLTADHRVILERSAEMITGMQIIMTVLGAQNCYIGIEDNKPDAIRLLQEQIKDPTFKIMPLPCKYPQGAEKTLVYALTGQEIPGGALPMELGIMVSNVETLVAVKQAVVDSIPLIERVVTVSGSCVKEPGNLLLPLGTSFEDALMDCGGLTEGPGKIVMGGPMMGFAVPTLQMPVIKGTSGILALSKKEVTVEKERACIRCGRCVNACPMGLFPSMLSITIERGRYDVAYKDYNLMDCVECGSCVYTCPAKRHIVQYIRTAKAQIAAQKKQEVKK